MSTSATPARTLSFDSSSAMRLIGTVAVILGGVVAAATGPLELSKGSWAAAYLVLVAGVAQVAMGSARRHWHAASSDRPGWWQLALWNLGNIGVLAGTVGGSVVAVFAGSALLVAALVMAFVGTFRLEATPHRLMLLGYRVLLVILAVSIPIGMVLSAIRNA